ncbi:hypothetical protein BS50DRAFT_149063 [Corynespora cassiicola Philippines]|uniref:Uncharacterized protein n=1 Tax=Corynespora cassiicola Philippines TaxID=1448308 RepID=A0A2T2N7E7_CORCC|nr:hypothetical protein BS50DRAFT_149063 [Corynespora cassiicola Philippines]
MTKDDDLPGSSRGLREVPWRYALATGTSLQFQDLQAHHWSMTIAYNVLFILSDVDILVAVVWGVNRCLRQRLVGGPVLIHVPIATHLSDGDGRCPVQPRVLMTS